MDNTFKEAVPAIEKDHKTQIALMEKEILEALNTESVFKDSEEFESGSESASQKQQTLENHTISLQIKLKKYKEQVKVEKAEMLNKDFKDLEKNIDSEIEKTFTDLDELETAHVNPLTDLGMTKKLAMDTLGRGQNRTAYGEIKSLQNKLSELEKIQSEHKKLEEKYGIVIGFLYTGDISQMRREFDALQKRFVDIYQIK